MSLPPRTKDLRDQEFDAWTVLQYVGRRDGCTWWLCKCRCGTIQPVISASLIQHRTRSCASCRAKSAARKHAESGVNRTREYRSWSGAVARCTNPNNRVWGAYGGRGIAVCPRWLGEAGYTTFLADMGRCPPGMTLDRENPDGNYCRDNCRWAARKTQDRNKRNSLFLVLNGEKRHVIEWAKIRKISANTLRRRKADGWSDERALTTPVFSGRIRSSRRS